MAVDPILTESYFKPITGTDNGRVAFQIQTGAGRTTTLECGYTGVRDITGLMANLTSGTVTVARDGYTVTYTFEDVKVSVASATLRASAADGLSMFYPAAGTVSGPVSQVNALAARVAITSTGILKLYNTSTTDGHNGTLTFTTSNAWTPTLPGVARGTGVVYL